MEIIVIVVGVGVVIFFGLVESVGHELKRIADALEKLAEK